jgi:amino acid adenylation domain-containing protein
MALSFLGVATTACAAPINPAYRAAEFEFFFNELKPKALIVADPTNAAVAVAKARNVRVIPATITAIAAEASYAEPPISRELPDAQDVALILHTSGTTSRPKMVPLTHGNLCASAFHIARCLELQPDDCCLNVMPLFHIHGLVAALLAPLASGGSVACTPGFISTEFFDWLRLTRATWYTAVPTMHQAILARSRSDPSLAAASNLHFVRSSSAALPPQVAEGLQQLFGVPVIEAYGMTEAAHQICTNPRAAGLQRFGSVGLPGGPEIAIMNDAGELLARGESGEVVIRGENVTAGYLANPEANASAFTHGWFRTGDLGRIDKDGFLYLSARIKEIINRGGEKVSPREVDEVLLTHPAVAEALTFAMPDGRLGEEIAAAVVLKSGENATEQVLAEFVANRLADFKVPRRIVVLDEIPKGPTGKPQRIGMATRLGIEKSGEEAARPLIQPRTETEHALAAIWREVLRIDSVASSDRFLQIGGDSILAAQVIARIRQRWGKEVSILAFFSSTTLADMAAALDAEATAAPAQPVPPISSHDVPASFAQRRLWFLDRLNPQSIAYNNAHLLRFTGRLDTAVLRRCAGQIVARHDALRMRFEEVDGEPIIRTAPADQTHVPLTDLSALPREERQVRADQLMVELSRAKFDLSTGPLVRLHLLKLGQDEHALVYVVHHIVSDRWSLGVFAGELIATYESAMSVRSSPLRELSISYSDYAARQNHLRSAESLEPLLEYWHKRLGSGLRAFELAPDHPRPALENSQGDTHRFRIPESLTLGLRQLGRAWEATLNMVLMAAFEALLFRYTNQEDALLGVVLAGRDAVELEGLIGLFVNVLPTRCQIRADTRFVDLLARTKADAIEMLDHQDVPFDKLVERMEVPRDASRSPLFQVVFNFHNVPPPPQASAVSGLQVTVDDICTATSRYDLALTIRPVGNELTAQLDYRRDLFEPETVGQLSENLLVLLQGIVADPAAAVGELPLLTPRQRHQLLVEWNSTGTDTAPEECVVQMFERHARLKPDALALIAGNQRLTYRQLNERANQIAHQLRSMGVGPNTLVAICLPRTERLLVAIMGVLKSGGAYVPLDPNYPRNRLAGILEDSEASVLLTEQRLMELTPSLPPNVVCFDRDAAQIALQPTTDPPQRSGPSDLAYVIYTSGSTGQPKGVAIEQASPAAFVNGTKAFLSDEHLRGVLFAASVCFDLSVFEIFVPLCRGGAIILAENGLELSRCAGVNELTCMYMVPSVMTEALHIGGLPTSIRVIVLGGEVVPESLARRCMSLPGIESVYVLYGPTEDTVSSTAYRVLPDAVGTPPIGRPIGGSRAYILDKLRQPVPVGAPGELYLGGVKVARGYLRRPELTAEKFMNDPFGPPGARMYATGDLCRYQRDGNIQYLGRIDHQIKLRGYRIELGEIDTVLSRHPAVRQCATITVGEGGDKILVSFLTAMQDARPSVVELRKHLARHLPEYMIPTKFIYRKSMPMDPSGKIDRRALRAVKLEDESAPDPWSPPVTNVEKQLASIWEGVLRVKRVGRDDNFFHIGGNSLRAVMTAGRVQRSMAKEVPVRVFFEHPTLCAFAKAIESMPPANSANRTTPALSLQPRPEPRISHTQKRLWFQHRITTNAGLYNVTTTQRLRGPLDAAKLEAALGKVIARHEVLRTSFPDTDGVPWPAIVPASLAQLKVSITDCSSRSAAEFESEIRRVLAAEAREAFDLTRWPLMRARLIRHSADEHVFVLTMHHIVCDDWSLRLLFDEISRLYDGDTLEPLPAQYSDFAAWLADWTTTPAFDEELSYWKKNLAGAPTLLQLPTDRPRPEIQTFVGTREPFNLDRNLTIALHSLAEQEGATVYMCLLAVFSALLMRWTGQTDMIIGAPIANRQRAEFQQLIGLFLNLQPLRMNISGDPTFRELVRQARKTAVDAYANQNVPFEIMLDRLFRKRNLGYAPLFQVLLVHLSESSPRLALTGIDADTVPSDGEGAKIDLTLYFNECDNQTSGSMEYNTDLFDRSTIRELIAQLLDLIRVAVASPDTPLSQLLLTGSVARHRLPAAALAPEPGVPQAPTSHALTATERALIDIWREILGTSYIGTNDNYFELGGTSFGAVRIFSQIERRLGVHLPLSTLFAAPTIAQLARRLDDAQATHPHSTDGVVLLRRGSQESPIFCVSGAGGHVFIFQNLAGLLETESAIYGLQHDGAIPERLEEIAASFIDLMRQVQPLGPYRLVGYSFGGAVVYEMAQQLTRMGSIVELLVLIDAFVPGSSGPKPILHRMGVHLTRLTAGGLRGALHHGRLIAQRCRQRILPPLPQIRRTDPDGRSMTEQAIKEIKRANIAAYARYRPIPYAGDVVLLFATGKDPWQDFFIDPSPDAWRGLVQGRFSIHRVPGSHHALFNEPNVRSLARQISRYLDPKRSVEDLRPSQRSGTEFDADTILA